MGIEFDRILEGVDGPFEEVKGFATPVEGEVHEGNKTAGFLIDHAVNDAVTVTNRLLAAKQKVYWLTSPVVAAGKQWPAGTVYIPSTRKALEILETAASDDGISAYGIDSRPAQTLMMLSAPRIGLWDRYGGSMESGWTRFILEQFGFNYEKVFPKRLDAGDLKKDFDVLVFVTRAIPYGESRSFSGYDRSGDEDESDIPVEYQDWLGNITTEKTVPQLITFLKEGGTILAIGSSTNLAYHADLPLGNHIVDGNGEQLGRNEYYIPASILQVRMNNELPIAWGMKERVDIFFSNSPVFRLKQDADKMGITPVAWFDTDKPLRSGWAWGQDRLYGGTAIVEAEVGKGKLYLFGPEILFRAQSHGTFKLFFNGLYLSTATIEK